MYVGCQLISNEEAWLGLMQYVTRPERQREKENKTGKSNQPSWHHYAVAGSERTRYITTSICNYISTITATHAAVQVYTY